MQQGFKFSFPDLSPARPRFFQIPARSSSSTLSGMLGAALLLCASLTASPAMAGIPATTATTPTASAPVAPVSNAPAASIAATADDAAVLARYQLALDQLASGSSVTARVILEDAARRYGARPDLNLLLAYIYQRDGKNAQALERVNQIAGTSPLAAAFAAQLGGAPATAPNNSVLNSTLPPPQGSAVPFLSAELLLSTATSLPSTVLATAQPGSSLTQSDARLSKLESAMLEMINAERAKAGLNALAWDDNLANVARAHAAEMRDKNYFSHDSPTPGLATHLDRYRAAGFSSPRVIAENIFRSWGTPHQVNLTDIQGGHEALMKSPGHRANILYRDVTRAGIGIAVNSRGDIWITQMFMRP